MTGRIKLLKNGVPVNATDAPPIEYEYDVPGEFDKKCGTFGLDEFQLPNAECPDKFVCLDDSLNDPALVNFAECIEAMDCAMVAGMTTKYSAASPVALFIHQMIPHHQNAVNMAKVLLNQNVLKCDDITNEEDADCILEVRLYVDNVFLKREFITRSVVHSQLFVVVVVVVGTGHSKGYSGDAKFPNSRNAICLGIE